MKRIFLVFSLIFLFQNITFATHNRAGEIRIEQIGPLTIRATIITYTKASSVGADRDKLELCWGDGVCEEVPRNNGPNNRGEIIGNDSKRNTYVATHTYPGRATYRISMLDPMRNGGILNVNNLQSDNVPFFIQTTYTFLNGNFQGVNNTPILLQPPVDFGCTNKVFTHNPNAYDPDGDSIAYRLGVPMQDVNTPVPLYISPDRIPNISANNSLSLDERTGTLTWRSPQRAGEYNISILVISYRGGFPIDTTIRDMQIFINSCNNNPPRVQSPNQICVIAGDSVAFDVTANDPDTGQRVNLTALGGPFVVPNSPATFAGSGGFRVPPITARFRWQTTCDHIAEQPYSVVFKAVDNFLDTTGLADLKTTLIKVVGPPPQAVQAQANPASVTVSWQKPYACENANNRYFYAFSVWRREDSNPFAIDTCVTGLAGRGYVRIAFDTSVPFTNNRYTFIDRSIERGKSYCYRIVAHFARRTITNNPFNLVESLPSEEVCVQLSRSIPLMLENSVTVTSATTGAIALRWTKPVAADLDTLQNPPPYRYVLSRSVGNANNFQVVRTWTHNAFFSANDTTFIDNALNTSLNTYYYRISFFARQDTLIGNSDNASSVFLTVAATDKMTILTWQSQTPWRNTRYDIFKKNNTTSQFDSLTSTIATTYRDSGLVNGREYCYYVRSSGAYNVANLPAPLLNLSQQVCATPLDTVPPCPPLLRAENVCTTPSVTDPLLNRLAWQKPNCNAQDLRGYNIYFTPQKGGTFSLLTNVNNPRDTTFGHRIDSSLAGCYYITAYDSLNNTSLKSEIVCIDNCPAYELPNAFTPNGDGDNEEFFATKNRFIARIELKIYNRWGQLVYQTENPNFKWNGKDLNNNDLPEATYHYVCKVYERRVSGEAAKEEPLSGFIELVK